MLTFLMIAISIILGIIVGEFACEMKYQMMNEHIQWDGNIEDDPEYTLDPPRIVMLTEEEVKKIIEEREKNNEDNA